MINLLPPDVKIDIFYARRNALLRNWILSALVALSGIGIIIAGGLIYMQQAANQQSAQVQQLKENLQAQKVDETAQRVDQISANTKLTVQVLSREVLFSKLIRKIGSALPANTALNSLTIDNIQGGIQLNAVAADFNAGTQLQLNLQDPKNGVFEKADINSITCGATEGSNNDPNEIRRLPCDVNVRALFSKNNSYVYISPNGSAANPQPGSTQ